MEKRLYRSRSDRMILGVCGGLAKYFEMDLTIIRMIAVLLIFAGLAGILVYIILAIVIPSEGSAAAEPKDTIKENMEEMKETASELGHEIQSTFSGKESESEEATKTRQRHHNTIGIILIVLGILFLLGTLGTFDFFWWLRWRYLWPLIPIAIGVLIILGARRKKT